MHRSINREPAKPDLVPAPLQIPTQPNQLDCLSSFNAYLRVLSPVPFLAPALGAVVSAASALSLLFVDQRAKRACRRRGYALSSVTLGHFMAERLGPQLASVIDTSLAGGCHG